MNETGLLIIRNPQQGVAEMSTPVPCPDTGSTAWLLVATILVLGMMPGLAFFEAGLLRKKSVLSVVTQIFLGLGVMATLWFLCGFSLVFGR
jgi:ammonium transporter, Amt family